MTPYEATGICEGFIECNDESKVAFALYPVSIEDLMSSSDEGKVMPPKSTWFEPKLVDGLISHTI